MPFTDNNNDFFQTWFNLNLTTLVFSTRKKFNAVLYVGTVPQFDGFIQLKGVYQKAQMYEVVLMSNTADLFSAIGSRKLRDVFLNDDGSYSDELNHTYNAANIEASWVGDNSAFVNTSAVSLRDTDVDVQKVMYPMSITVPQFYFSGGSEVFLDMTQANADAMELEDAALKVVPITQFRPSIQLKTLFKLIFARSGFSYTSEFIDGDYFGKLFMTTCGHLASPGPIEKSTVASIDGSLSVGNSTQWGIYEFTVADTLDCGEDWGWKRIPADTNTPPAGYSVPYDTTGLWNTTSDTFTRAEANMVSLNVKFTYSRENLVPQSQSSQGSNCLDQNNNEILWEFEVREPGAIGDTYSYIPQWLEVAPGSYGYDLVDIDLPLTEVPVGYPCSIYVRARYFNKYGAGSAAKLIMGSSQCLPPSNSSVPFACATADYLYGSMYNLITVNWLGYATNIYGQTVDVPAGIDETITQKDFLKDIIERFNLVVMSDPDNSTNVIIEPYNDYLSGGELKYWTDKLDLSKEIVVRDTTSLQKQTVLLSDLEDNDLMNKSIREEQPDYNVYGKLDIRETNNEFATGEMKNTPLYSPYINQKVFANNNEDSPTGLTNMAVQYEYTYKKTESGYEDVLETTKAKLFYYNGSPTLVNGAIKYYLHQQAPTTGVITAHEFDTYPLCSPFELTPDSDGQSIIVAGTKSLYWNQNPPPCGDLAVFNYLPNSLLLLNSLYYLYWYQYLISLYHPDARIMECHLNLNEVDIFKFKFNDEILIKDNYWRVLNISNYQVGAKASTKVTLIRINEVYDNTCFDCDYVIGNIGTSNTTGPFYNWCPEDDPDCTPSYTNFVGMMTTEACCECQGGDFIDLSSWSTLGAGFGFCEANTGSLPVQLQNIYSIRSIFSNTQTKAIYSGKIGGLNKPLITGSYTNKYTTPILPYAGNDVVIKYNVSPKSTPQLDGESHRIVLTGDTNANTRGYAYVQGDSNKSKLTVPNNSNMIIRVKGISTVIGGTSATYILGTTEGFAYYTAFKNIAGAITQLSTAGGQQEFSIREGVLATTCTLYITTSGNELQFGLDDSQTDTKRIWTLTADIDVNRIYHMEYAYGENWALWQDGQNIEFQNLDLLIWN